MEAKHPMDELHQKISAVEDALSQISHLKQKLEQNVEQVKSEIHSKISCHLEQLHSREIQLLRQVDVFTSHQMALLQTQYAKLYHTLGTLQSALATSDDHSTINASTILDDMKSVEQIKAQMIPLLSWKADVCGLQNSIHNFGIIRLLGGVLQLPLPQVSKCLPSRIEEYEDGDHHILYKTLESLKAEKENGSKLKITFPHFSPKTEDWLQKQNKEFMPPKLNFSPVKSSQLENWLHQIKTEVELEPSMEEDEFHCIPSISDISESIEMVSHPETSSVINSSLMESKFNFNQWMEPTSNWLSINHVKNEIKNDCNPEECCCKGKNIEIENLAQKFCSFSLPNKDENEQSFWLSRSKSVSSQDETSTALISQVCRANELCKSFEECVCEEKCCLQQENDNWEAVKLDKNVRDLLLLPMVNIRDSNQDKWLHCNEKMEEEDVKENLFTSLKVFQKNKVNSTENEMPPSPISFPNMQRSVETTSWLPNQTPEKTDSNKESVCKQDNSSTETWLLNQLSLKTDIEPKMAVLSMFKEYLQPPNLNIWLWKKPDSQHLNSDLINKMKWLAINSVQSPLNGQNHILHSLNSNNWLCN